MRLLQLGVRVGDQGARSAQAKTELAEHSLALAHAQLNSVAPREPSLQRLPIPKRAGQADLAGGLSQHGLHLLKLSLAQALRPSGPCSFGQPHRLSQGEGWSLHTEY